MTRDETILAWRDAQATLETAKADELRLRHAAIAIAFPGAYSEGTHNLDLGGGWRLSYENRLNYNLDKVALPIALQAITARHGNNVIATRLCSWKPSLLVGEYRKIDLDDKRLIDRALTIKPATPSLDLIEPKKNGAKT